MQRETPRADAPLYSCPSRIHLDPAYQINSVAAVLMQKGYEEEDAYAAASRIEEKCREATQR